MKKRAPNQKAKVLKTQYAKFFAIMLTSGVAQGLIDSYDELLDVLEKDTSNDDIRDAAIEVAAQLGGWLKFGDGVRKKWEKQRGKARKKA